MENKNTSEEFDGFVAFLNETHDNFTMQCNSCCYAWVMEFFQTHATCPLCGQEGEVEKD